MGRAIRSPPRRRLSTPPQFSGVKRRQAPRDSESSPRRHLGGGNGLRWSHLKAPGACGGFEAAAGRANATKNIANDSRRSASNCFLCVSNLPIGHPAPRTGKINASNFNAMLVLPVRIELTTSALPRMRSTTELRQHRRQAGPAAVRRLWRKDFRRVKALPRCSLLARSGSAGKIRAFHRSRRGERCAR